MGAYCLAAYTAVTTLIALAPNIDGFMSVRMGFQTVLSGAGLIDAEAAAKYYYILVPLMIAPMAMAGFLVDLKDWRRNGTIFGAAAVAGCIFLSFLRNGEGLYTALRQHEVSNVLLIACGIAIGSASWLWPWLRFGVIVGFAGAVAAKIVDSIYLYSQGGIMLVGDGLSMQIDGGALMLLGLSALLLAAIVIHSSEQKKIPQAVLLGFVCLGVVAALVSGFRRLAVLRFLSALVIWTGLIWWSRGRSTALLFRLSMAAMLTGLIMYFSGLVMFGQERLHERVMSLFAKTGTGFSASNSLYLSDWASFGQAWEKAGFLGIGTSKDYNVPREADMVFGAEFVPFHTGGFELMISVGLVGTVFLIFGLGGGYWTGGRELLRRIRGVHGPARAEMETVLVLVTFAAMVVFFPFASPFYFSPQACLVVGFALGISVTRRLPQAPIPKP